MLQYFYPFFVEPLDEQIRTNMENLPLCLVDVEHFSVSHEVDDSVHTSDMLVQLIHEFLQGLVFVAQCRIEVADFSVLLLVELPDSLQQVVGSLQIFLGGPDKDVGWHRHKLVKALAAFAVGQDAGVVALMSNIDVVHTTCIGLVVERTDVNILWGSTLRHRLVGVGIVHVLLRITVEDETKLISVHAVIHGDVLVPSLVIGGMLLLLR